MLPAPVNLPSVVIPVIAPTFGNQSLNADTTLAPATYGDVSVTSGATLTLQSGEYVMNSLKLVGGAIVYVDISSGPVIVYIVSDLDLGGGTVVNDSTQSTNLIFMVGPAATTVKVTGGANAAYALYAPDSDVTVSGGGEIFGAIIGNTITSVGGAQIHYDKALATVSAGGFTCTPTEISRATPIVADIGGQSSIVQGTFESSTSSEPTFANVTQLASWSFPHVKGHMRARVASTIPDTKLDSGTVQFDTATGIPTANYGGCTDFKTTCRNVFTTVNTMDGTTATPTVLQFNDTNASTIGPLITGGLSGAAGFTTTDWQTIIHDVLDGGLGGVDRSTVAVIGPSNFAGQGKRPTMIYFGGADGMLHAVCGSAAAGQSTGTDADQTGLCPVGSLGKEMWAFLPRPELPLLPRNAARIDGSVHVIDVFGDFPSAQAGAPYTAPAAPSGKNSFHTILYFQTGFALGTTPAAYALDVTDPARPVVLWEYATPASPASVDFGAGLTVAAGTTLINNQSTNLAIFETANGGSSKATVTGVVTTALNAVDGTVKWQFKHSYADPPRGVAGDEMPLPPQSMPGGAVGIDLTGANLGFISHYVFGDIYGNLWKLDATTGSPPTGGSGLPCTVDATSFANCLPIFSFSTNKHSIGALPTVFQRTSGGEQFIAFASGGYADPVATLWSASTQKLIAVKASPSTLPVDETTAACALSTCDVLVNADFASGDRGFSQAQIIGSKLVVTTDSLDINEAGYGIGTADTGNIYSTDVLAGATTVISAGTTVHRGAGAVAANTARTTAYTAHGEATTVSTSGGVAVDPNASDKIVRRLWLRSI